MDRLPANSWKKAKKQAPLVLRPVREQGQKRTRERKLVEREEGNTEDKKTRTKKEEEERNILSTTWGKIYKERGLKRWLSG